MSLQLNLLDTLSATSSLELESGVTPCDLQDGPMTNPSGPDPAHANLSPRQAKERGLLMSGTYGQHSSGTSSSAALAQSLANRLHPVTDLLGSTLFRLTWKRRTTPSRRSIYALRASARRTFGSGYSSWRTPDAMQCGGAQSAQSAQKRLEGGHALRLQDQVTLIGWGTPSARDWKDGAEVEAVEENSLLGRQVWQAGWNTPRATDGSNGGPNQAGGALPADAHQCLDGPARLTAHGEVLTGSSAGMDSGGPLKPEHSRWLMGLPSVWDDCGVTAMQSLRGSRKHSSKHQ